MKTIIFIWGSIGKKKGLVQIGKFKLPNFTEIYNFNFISSK